MSEINGDKDWKSAVEAREFVLGNRQNKPIEVFKHAGIVSDDEMREFLSLCKMFYDPNKSDLDIAQFEDTRLYRMLVGRFGTETLTNSLKTNNPQVQSYFVGNPGSRSDISGMKAIEELKKIIEGEAPILYIWGPPNSGKTNFAILLAQMWKRYFHENGEIGTNIRTLDEKDEWLQQWGNLKQWLQENVTDIKGGGKTLEKGSNSKLYIFDEASTHANGSGEEGYETRQKLSPMVYKIRKAGAGLIIIGHDGKDVDPSVRTLATCIRKYRDNQKLARVFEDVQERKGINELPYSPIKGIPETDWNSYDDKEATSFDWSEATTKSKEPDEQTLSRAEEIADEIVDEKVDKLMARLYISSGPEITYEKVGNAFGVSGTTVSRRVEEYGEQIARGEADQ